MKCKTCGTDHRGVAKHGGYCLDHQELRAEAAEVAAAESAAFARGLQNELKAAEAERDELRAELNTVNMLRTGSESACDELRRQLTEAQHAIDVLSNTVIAQNDEIKRLRQKHEDVEQYRAEIERLNQAREALNLLATDKITLGLSAHYRATCSGAYRASDKRIDPLANALSILGIDEP